MKTKGISLTFSFIHSVKVSISICLHVVFFPMIWHERWVYASPWHSLNSECFHSRARFAMNGPWITSTASATCPGDVQLNSCSQTIFKSKTSALDWKPLHNTPRYTRAPLLEVSLLSALVMGHNRCIHIAVQRRAHIYNVRPLLFHHRDVEISDKRQEEAR